jgi:hypothetical protein
VRSKSLPLFHVQCGKCGAEDDRLAPTGADAVKEPCACRAKMRRKARGPSTAVMERLDNGAMPRAVERLADAERLHKERAANADPLAGGAQFEIPKKP